MAMKTTMLTADKWSYRKGTTEGTDYRAGYKQEH